METKLSRFLRTGGRGEAIVTFPGIGTKAQVLLRAKTNLPGYQQLRAEFLRELEAQDRLNRDLLLRAVGSSFDPPLSEADLAPVDDDIEAVLAEWERRVEVLWNEWSAWPEQFASSRRRTEDDLARAFGGPINERRQSALGIDQYIWRSQDDSRVRNLHAEHDDRVFDWDDPPEGGHPGEAPGCRCHAQPFLPDEPEYVPETGLRYRLGRAGAEIVGIQEAVGDILEDFVDTIRDLPEKIRFLGRLTNLRVKEARGTLTDTEAEELRRIDAAIEARIDEIREALRNSPELAEAFARYAHAVQRRPAMMDEAYREGLATEQEVRDAFRERAYFDTLVAVNLAPGGLLTRVLRRRGRRGDLDDRDAAKELREAEREARRRPEDVDWEVIDLDIPFGRGIREQGDAWEGYLERRGDLGVRSPSSFPVFDFSDDPTGIATSAKTLNSGPGTSYRDRPASIHSRLMSYAKRASEFEYGVQGSYVIDGMDITDRVIRLSVPDDLNPEQITHIKRAIEDARNLDTPVTIVVTRIR